MAVAKAVTGRSFGLKTNSGTDWPLKEEAQLEPAYNSDNRDCIDASTGTRFWGGRWHGASNKDTWQAHRGGGGSSFDQWRDTGWNETSGTGKNWSDGAHRKEQWQQESQISDKGGWGGGGDDND